MKIAFLTIMSDKTYKDQRLSLYIAECKFRKSCEQIKLLTRRLDLLQIRYDKAKRDDMKSFRYTQRLQLATVEGARNMYYEYAVKQAREVARLQKQLKSQHWDSQDRNHFIWRTGGENTAQEKLAEKQSALLRALHIFQKESKLLLQTLLFVLNTRIYFLFKYYI